MVFLVYSALTLIGFFVFFQIIFKIYYQFWLRPILMAWKPHSLEWNNWREIKSFSRTKSIHVLVLITGLVRNDMVQARVRQDLSREILEYHLGEVEPIGTTLNSCLYYEYRVVPTHLRKGKKKSRIPIKLIFRPNFQLS